MFVRNLFLLALLLPVTFVAKAGSDSSRHHLAVNFVPAVWKMASVSYECILGKGKLGLRVPLAFGFGADVGSDEGSDARYKGGVYAFGLDVNYYKGEGCFSPKKVKMFFGPSIEYVAARYVHYSPVYDSLYGGYVPFRDDRTGYQYCALFKVGWKLLFGKRFYFSPVVGLGLRVFTGGYGRSAGPATGFELNTGFRF